MIQLLGGQSCSYGLFTNIEKISVGLISPRLSFAQSLIARSTFGAVRTHLKYAGPGNGQAAAADVAIMLAIGNARAWSPPNSRLITKSCIISPASGMKSTGLLSCQRSTWRLAIAAISRLMLAIAGLFKESASSRRKWSNVGRASGGS